MLKPNSFTGSHILKAIYVTLIISLLFLFIDVHTSPIKHTPLFSIKSGAAQGIIIFIAFLVVRKMIFLKGVKKTVIIIFSTLLAINTVIAIINFIPKDEEKPKAELQTDTDTDTQTQIDISTSSNNEREEIEVVEEKKQEKEDPEKPFGSTLSNIILKYSWLINFMLLAIVSFVAFQFTRKKQDTIIEEIIEEVVPIEIQIDEVTAENYEDGVYKIYRQLCEIAKERNGITRQISMTSTEYGELLIKLDFPETDIINIIEAFEALRYGDIQISNEHIVQLNTALNNINQAMRQHD